MRPNFFIIGAPKCGTTSLANWLGAHPDIFMPSIKEPHYFSEDIPCANRIVDAADYFELFKAAPRNCKAVGEASTGYLRSSCAVQRILAQLPGAKFIVCLRNPVDMVPSVHMQLVRGGREPVQSLEQAWALQEHRQQGRLIPRGETAEAFQYGRVCALGSQVERLLELVERESVMFVLLDDMQHDAGGTYRNVLKFLSVKADERQEFLAANTRREPKSMLISKLIKGLSRLKFAVGFQRRTGVGALLQRLNCRLPTDKPNAEFKLRLQEFFRKEIDLLEMLIQRDLSGWRSSR